jgi:hypothetical protein
MNDVSRVAEMILKEMAVDATVTPQILAVFRQFPYNVLVRPIVVKMEKEGLTQKQISIKLGITVRSVQWILSKGDYK